MTESGTYEAVLIVTFGGPNGPHDVMPFLENVLRGRNVPEERKREVARHYERFGGVSPINARNDELAASLCALLEAKGPDLPVYIGNRNWHPFLADTLRRMKKDGIRRALAFAASAYGSYPGCRQYREDIVRARAEVGEGAPALDKIRLFYNHPLFIEAQVAGVRQTLASMPEGTHVVFTAHSLPSAMARTGPYESQLEETCRLVATGAGVDYWSRAYQSRSGSPRDAWLEPDIGDHLRELKSGGVNRVVIAPAGFVTDHMEVVYDLDIEARAVCGEIGLTMTRAPTAGGRPEFAAMIRELILERTNGAERRATGTSGPWPDDCPMSCCMPASST